MARIPKGITIRVRNKTYYARFSVEGQERPERSIGRTDQISAREAYAKAQEVYHQILKDRQALTIGKGAETAQAPLSELLAHWLVWISQNKSEGWHEACETYARAYWLPRWSTLDEITEASLQDYMQDRCLLVTSGSVRKELSALRSFFRHFCLPRGYAKAIPNFTPPPENMNYKPTYLSEAEMQKLLAALPDRHSHIRKAPVREYFTILWYTSFRRGTLSRIQWSDLDLDQGLLTVRAAVDKKRYGRVVPLATKVVEVLRSMPPGEGPVFGLHDYRVALRRAAKKVGISESIANRLGNHSIRHSRITYLCANSKNIPAVQYLAGHKHLISTERYVHSGVDSAKNLLVEIGELAPDAPKK